MVLFVVHELSGMILVMKILCSTWTGVQSHACVEPPCLRGPFQSLSLFKRLAVKCHVVLTLLVWYVKNTSVLSLVVLQLSELSGYSPFGESSTWPRIVVLPALSVVYAVPNEIDIAILWWWTCARMMERWEQPRFLAAPISITGGISR